MKRKRIVYMVNTQVCVAEVEDVTKLCHLSFFSVLSLVSTC